jgi:hypothetical protein
MWRLVGGSLRCNERKDDSGDHGRFVNLAKTAPGRRLTWKKLTGKEQQE